MSYSPTTWETGDTVTPAKLNKIEQGISTAENYSDEILVINCTKVYDQIEGMYEYTMDQTGLAIINAMAEGKMAIVFTRIEGNNGSWVLTEISIVDNASPERIDDDWYYYINCRANGDQQTFSSMNDGYPHLSYWS